MTLPNRHESRRLRCVCPENALLRGFEREVADKHCEDVVGLEGFDFDQVDVGRQGLMS